MRKYNVHDLLRSLVGTLGVVVLSATPVMAEDISARVLARYPTREQLQQEVDKIKASDPAAFEAARLDFDRAIWQRRVLVGPPRPGPPLPRPIVRSGPTLRVLWTPWEWEHYIAHTEKMKGGAALAQFYRDNIDGFTIDDSSPVLKEVLIDVVLNGWHDWTHWDHEKLVELREKFPELHRVYALRELQRLKSTEIAGVLLVLIGQTDLTPELFSPVRQGVKALVAPEDSFEFVLDVYMQSSDPVIRIRMEHFIPSFSIRASKSDRVREIWRPFLESETPLLRFEARRAFDLPIPDPFARDDIHKRWIAENDPDPGRREKARQAVKNRETVEGIYRRQEKQKR